MSEKVAVFIDAANLFNGLIKDHKRIDLNYELFINKLVAGRMFTRAYYYTALPHQERNPEQYAKQQRFLHALKSVPYLQIKYGRLEYRASGYVEKGVDISLAVDMLDFAYRNTYDTAVLVSGDGDYANAVKIIQDMGKHVENAASQSCLSQNLRQVSDKTIVIDPPFLQDCWRNPKP